MALHINLFHEIHSEARARQRDPLKLGLYLVILIALCFVGYYLLRLRAVALVVAEQQAVEAQWAALQPREVQAKERAAELEITIARSANLVEFVEKRFHWAPIMEDIGRIVPSTVQITKLYGDLRSQEQCQITIEGVTAGEKPRTIAEDLRIALGTELSKRYQDASGAFVALEDGSETIAVGGAQRPTAVFTIRVELNPSRLATASDPSQTPAEEQPATPAAAAPAPVAAEQEP